MDPVLVPVLPIRVDWTEISLGFAGGQSPGLAERYLVGVVVMTLRILFSPDKLQRNAICGMRDPWCAVPGLRFLVSSS